MSSRHTIHTPLIQRLKDLVGPPINALVWAAAVVTAVVVLAGRQARTEYAGLAVATEFELSPTTDGLLERLAVDLYESVEAGQVLASLDPAHLQARLATAEAELKGLASQLAAARVTVERGVGTPELDWRAELRRFEVDVEQRRLEELALQVAIESDKAEEQRLALALARFTTLLAEGVVSQAEHDDIRLRRQAVGARLAENINLLARTREQFHTANERKLAFERNLPRFGREQALLAPLRAALEAQEARIAEIGVEGERLLLRSPVTGKVSRLLARPGQALLAGEPVAMVAPLHARHVVGYLPENHARRLNLNTPVILTSHGPRLHEAASVVLRVSPAVELLPERLWLLPNAAEYGRPFVVAAAASLDLVPGQSVGIRLEE